MPTMKLKLLEERIVSALGRRAEEGRRRPRREVMA